MLAMNVDIGNHFGKENTLQIEKNIALDLRD